MKLRELLNVTALNCELEMNFWDRKSDVGVDDPEIFTGTVRQFKEGLSDTELNGTVGFISARDRHYLSIYVKE